MTVAAISLREINRTAMPFETWPREEPPRGLSASRIRYDSALGRMSFSPVTGFGDPKADPPCEYPSRDTSQPIWPWFS